MTDNQATTDRGHTGQPDTGIRHANPHSWDRKTTLHAGGERP